MRWLLAMLTLTSCASAIETRTRVTLAKLPTCEDRSIAGPLTIVWSERTKKCEGYACCNLLGIERAFITTAAGEVAVGRERVQDVLNVGSLIDECDSADIDALLEGVSLSLAEPACVVR